MSPLTANTAPTPPTQARHRWQPSHAAAFGVALAVVAGTLMLGRHGVWNVLLLLVLAPVLEEVVFRAGLQESLLRRGLAPMASTLLTAAAFALMHGWSRSWPLAAGVFVPALALGAVYAHTRQLGPVMALHAVMNFVWLSAGSAWTGLFVVTPS